MRENKGKSIIALPSEYIVIDTETTGLDYECCHLIEVAAVKYSNGVETGRFSSLVKPELYETLNDNDEWVPEYVDEFITQLTGITNEMLAAAPGPEEVIPQFLDFLGDAVLIGHNANFDINFLYDAAEAVGRTLSNNFIDNLRISRKVFPELPHHRLADIAKACAIPQPEAHRAEADCIVTAGCFEQMKAKVLQDHSEEDFVKLFKRRKSSSRRDALANVTATTDEIDDTNPIFGKVVVFTGALSSMSRLNAFQIVADLGATPQDSVTKKTNFLVIGKADFVKSVKEGKTTKMKKAESLIAKGNDLAILSEDAFFDLIADYR